MNSSGCHQTRKITESKQMAARSSCLEQQIVIPEASEATFSESLTIEIDSTSFTSDEEELWCNCCDL